MVRLRIVEHDGVRVDWVDEGGEGAGEVSWLVQGLVHSAVVGRGGEVLVVRMMPMFVSQMVRFPVAMMFPLCESISNRKTLRCIPYVVLIIRVLNVVIGPGRWVRNLVSDVPS